MINGRSITIVLIFMSTLLVDVQAEDEGLVDAVPNYMFSVVLGSGFYRVEDATLTTVRIPFSKTLRELNAEQDGIKLLLPVTVGYVSLDPDDFIVEIFGRGEFFGLDAAFTEHIADTLVVLDVLLGDVVFAL